MRNAPALLSALAAALLPGAALAHAALLNSVPGSRDTLSRLPPAIVLTFNEPVEARFSTVTVDGPDGAPVALGPLQRAADDPARIECALPRSLPAGSYTVRYRVLSQDGHVVEYGYQFRLAPAANADD